VVDAGFGVRKGLVVPFPNVRYHLQDWRDADRRPRTKKELYNLRHCGLRVRVEHAFGHVKRRWKLVRCAPIEYSIKKQVQIVYAVTGLHNFIIYERGVEPLSTDERITLSAARD
jgi:hypothetical protein